MWTRIVCMFGLVCCGLICCWGAPLGAAPPDDTPQAARVANDPLAEVAPRDAPQAGDQVVLAPIPEPPGLKRLHPGSDVWVDTKQKRVVVGARVCLREGPLEMFACKLNSKEHESVIHVRTEAYVLHAALLTVGAEVGHPVQFQPQFKPAAGTTIDVVAWWTDADGKRQKIDARQWVRDVRTRQALGSSWVFAGSTFWQNPETGERRYMAEDGDLICVANFPAATLDLPLESSQANASLVFEAFTENIPPLGTPVTLLLVPRLEKPVEK